MSTTILLPQRIAQRRTEYGRGETISGGGEQFYGSGVLGNSTP